MLYRLRYLFSADKELFDSLSNILGFEPRNIYLYKQCLRHRSVTSQGQGQTENNNERLEFLGDAVLGTIVAHYLFSKFPYKDEGFLTKIRSRIVSRQNLNKLSGKLGLDKLIVSRKEQKHGFHSMQGDALEAFIGAIFIDRGYKKAEQFVIEKLIRLHLDIEEILVTDTDYKSRMVEWSQKRKLKLTYQILEEQQNNQFRHYKIQLSLSSGESVTGQGSSKKQAEQHAAELMCQLTGA